MCKKDERGQAVVIAAFLVGFMVAVAILVTHVAAAANTQAEAQTAADAAALAGVSAGDRGARTAATANGADLASVIHQGDEVLVRVTIGSRSAKARAKLTGGLG